MMYVEDALSKLYLAIMQDDLFLSVDPDNWAFNFVVNVQRFMLKGGPLSTEQGRIALKLFERALPLLLANKRVSEKEAIRLLNEPLFKKEPFQSANIPREVRYLGDNLIGFRFKLNDIILQDVKGLKKYCLRDEVRFDRTARVWVVPVTKRTIDPIRNIIKTHRFSFDDDLADFLAQCRIQAEKPSEVFHDDANILVRVNGVDLLGKFLVNVMDAEVV